MSRKAAGAALVGAQSRRMAHVLSLQSPHAAPMGRKLTSQVFTLAELDAGGFDIVCECPRCHRRVRLQPQALVDGGFADTRLVDFRPRCRSCGTPGGAEARPRTRWPAQSVPARARRASQPRSIGTGGVQPSLL